MAKGMSCQYAAFDKTDSVTMNNRILHTMIILCTCNDKAAHRSTVPGGDRSLCIASSL